MNGLQDARSSNQNKQGPGQGQLRTVGDKEHVIRHDAGITATTSRNCRLV